MKLQIVWKDNIVKVDLSINGKEPTKEGNLLEWVMGMNIYRPREPGETVIFSGKTLAT